MSDPEEAKAKATKKKDKEKDKGDLTRTKTDEYGKLVQRLSTRGNWIDSKRILTYDGKEYEINLEPRKVKTKDYLTAIAGDGLILSMNDMSDRMEVDGQPLNDHKEAVMLNRLRDIGLKGEQRMRQAIMQGAYEKRYHPIKNYLRSLKWDGSDHIVELVRYFDAPSMPDGLLLTYWRKWLIGAVAKIMKHGQNFMLVLDGPQGIGKSYLSRWLCPKPLRDEYFIEGAIQPDDKDSFIRLMSKWIWEVGELQSTTRRADMEALKDFISRRDVTVRLPYGRYDVVKPAAASLIGTINESGGGFLGDMTGTRRFAICRLDAVNWGYSDIDVDQLWAQAFALFADGENWELTRTERQAQEQINREYEVPSTVGELFYRYFDIEPGVTEDDASFMPSSEILEELRLQGLDRNRSKAQYMELAALMKRAGVTKHRVDNVNGYCGVVLKQKKQSSASNGKVMW